MIKIKNITYNYDKRFSTLFQLNLEIEKGEKIILLNETGLESQTLFRLISKQDKIQKGEIFLNNQNLKDTKLKNLSVCYITKNPFLLNKKVIENLTYPLTVRKIDKHSALKKANDILQKFNCTNLANTKPNQLTNFEKTKVCVLRAFMREYEILLVDDIFNFNASENDELINLINELSNNKTCIINIKNNLLINKIKNNKIFKLNNSLLTFFN